MTDHAACAVDSLQVEDSPLGRERGRPISPFVAHGVERLSVPRHVAPAEVIGRRLFEPRRPEPEKRLAQPVGSRRRRGAQARMLS